MTGWYRGITELGCQVAIKYIKRLWQTIVDLIRHGGCAPLSIFWSITCKANLPWPPWKAWSLYKGFSMGEVHQRVNAARLGKMMRARRPWLRLVDQRTAWAVCTPECLRKPGAHILRVRSTAECGELG
jgi:hypothetical protein